MWWPRVRVLGVGVCGAALMAALPARAEALFDLLELESPGRTQIVELVDLDGDGRGDLLEVAFLGLPPEQQREIRVRFQSARRTLSRQPDWSGPVFDDAVTYDLADLDGDGGIELLLMRSDRVTAISFAGREPRPIEIPIPGPPPLTVWPDERGLDRLHMARRDLGPELRLLIPLFGEALVLTPAGESLGRMAVGARANYFVPRKSVPALTENEIELYFDHPGMNTGDVDGDGRPDVIASNRHEIRVFLQRPDGSFEREPVRVVRPGLLSETDHIQLSGTVRTECGDFDGDGRVDLLVSHTSGGIFDAESEMRVLINRDGSWNPAAPVQSLHEKGSVSRNLLIDLDGDGRPELVHVRVPLGVLEAVEVLLTRAIDANLSFHRAQADGSFARESLYSHKLDLAISLERQSSLGFVPTLDADLNGDGFRDLLDSGGGEALEVHLGGAEQPYRTRAVQKDLDTGGRIRFGDLSSDGLTDFAIYDPRRPESTIRVGINRGALPGSRSRTEIGPAEARNPSNGGRNPATGSGR